MPTIVPLRLETATGSRPGTILESAAVVNTGYRADRREISLPGGAARELGLWPDLPEGAEEVTIQGYAGRTRVASIADAVRVSVMTEDRETPCVSSGILVHPDEDEILISDAATSALNIVLLDPFRGRWRLRDDPPELERPSVPPRWWRRISSADSGS